MNKQTLDEILAALATPEDLPLGSVRHFLALRPQARELVERLDALEKNVGVLLETPPTARTQVVEPVPATVVGDKVQRELPTPQPRTETWTLHEDDIKPGIIAWFDDNTLNTDRYVSKPTQFSGFVSKKAKGGRPFVCIEVDEDSSSWASLSAQYRDVYMKMDPAWVRPVGVFNKTSYVTGHVYEGPHHSFCIAAAQVEFADAGRRPRLIGKGLDAVIEWIEKSQS